MSATTASAGSVDSDNGNGGCPRIPRLVVLTKSDTPASDASRSSQLSTRAP